MKSEKRGWVGNERNKRNYFFCITALSTVACFLGIIRGALEQEQK